MELLLVYLNAFLRPIFLIEFGDTGGGGGGSELFNLFAIVMFVILAGAFLYNSALRKHFAVTVIDLVIFALVGWCVVAYIVYIDKANARELIKFVFPLFVYIVVKNILPDRERYRRMIFYMILGFVIPIFWSAGLFLMGGGVEYVNEFTRVGRYQGVFPGAHQLAYGAGFLIMLLLLHYQLGRRELEPGRTAVGGGRGFSIFAWIIGVAATYCLLLSQVRAAYIGVLVFLGYYLFVFNRRAFFIVSVVSIAALVAFFPYVYDVVLYDLKNVEEGEWGREDIGSGRPRIWMNNIEIFGSMPIDRMLAGVGIGNKGQFGGREGILDSHNDYLDVLIQTGIVGFMLYAALQLLFLRAILKTPGPERHVLLGMFVAIALMNISSNAFITRSGNAQMYLLALAYVEARRRSYDKPERDGVANRQHGAGAP